AVGLDPDEPTSGAVGDVDLAHLEAVITETLAALFPDLPTPEVFERFTARLLGALEDLSLARAAAGLPGAQVLRHCVIRTTVLLATLQASTSLERADQLSTSLVEQYDVGMGLLGRLGRDPS